jgi:hypothetical protein
MLHACIFLDRRPGDHTQLGQYRIVAHPERMQLRTRSYGCSAILPPTPTVESMSNVRTWAHPVVRARAEQSEICQQWTFANGSVGVLAVSSANRQLQQRAAHGHRLSSLFLPCCEGFDLPVRNHTDR